MVSLAPTVSAARTAMPSIAAASKGGEEVRAQTGSAVTRPTASSRRSRTALEPLRAAGGRARLLPGRERLGGGSIVDERSGVGRGVLHYHQQSLERAVGAARLVERVERGHFLVGQGEVENLAVLLESLAVSRLHDHDHIPLHAPAQKHLRRRAPHAFGDLLHTSVREMPAGAERAVRLDRHLALLARVEQFPPVLERAELHLIHDRRGLGDRHQLVELAHAEVRNTDRARVAAFTRTFHPGPGPGRSALRPVDDVEVDLLDAKPFQAPLRLGLRVLPRRIELGRDEDLLARHAAVAKGAADARLVAVCLRGVDMAVAELQRPADRVLGLGPVRDLPDAEAENRNLVAVCEHACVLIPGTSPCYGGGISVSRTA